MSDLQLEPARAAPPRRARDPWLRFACPHCGKRNKLDSMSAGRCAACARCGQAVLLETAGDAPAPPKPSLPVMKAVDPKPIEPTSAEPKSAEPTSAEPKPAPSPLRQLSAHVAARDEAARAVAAAPRPPLRLPTWAMVTMHVGLTLGTIAAVWALHEYGYLPGFDPPTQRTIVVVQSATAAR